MHVSGSLTARRLSWQARGLAARFETLKQGIGFALSTMLLVRVCPAVLQLLLCVSPWSPHYASECSKIHPLQGQLSNPICLCQRVRCFLEIPHRRGYLGMQAARVHLFCLVSRRHRVTPVSRDFDWTEF